MFNAVLLAFIKLLQYLAIWFISCSIFIQNKMKFENWKLNPSLWDFLDSPPPPFISSYLYCSGCSLELILRATFLSFQVISLLTGEFFYLWPLKRLLSFPFYNSTSSDIWLVFSFMTHLKS